MSTTAYLSHARYGKDKVRVFRVVRGDNWHTVVEYNVSALLEGDIEVRLVSSLSSLLAFSLDGGCPCGWAVKVIAVEYRGGPKLSRGTPWIYPRVLTTLIH